MKKTAILLLPLFLLSATPALAEVRIEQGSSNVDVRVNNHYSSNSHIDVSTDTGGKVVVSQNGSGDNSSVRVENNNFDITGNITSVSGNNFHVSGQPITIDKSKVSHFNQNGSLENGARIRVRGQVVDGTFYASDIDVTGASSTSASITSTPSTPPTPSIPPFPSLNPFPTPSIPDPSVLGSQIKAEQKNVIQRIITALENLITSLKNLI